MSTRSYGCTSATESSGTLAVGLTCLQGLWYNRRMFRKRQEGDAKGGSIVGTWAAKHKALQSAKKEPWSGKGWRKGSGSPIRGGKRNISSL